jgi:peroxiredoxin
MSTQLKLKFGEPAPWFIARTSSNERFVFNSVGGRFVVLGFYGSMNTQFGKKLNAAMHAIRPILDDTNVCFFGVSHDPEDESKGRAADSLPGIRYFWDFERKVSTLYQATGNDGQFHEMVYVLDPMLRVVRRFDFSPDDENFDALTAMLHALPKIDRPYMALPQAPVLVVPRIFEPGLCEALIDYYAKNDSEDSGFMRERDGKTVGLIDYSHKRRRDCQIEDAQLRNDCMQRIHDRLVPEIEKGFQFKANRIERYVVACYDGSEKGHFRAHRDNTTPGTAHRKFAVSLFLNSGAYEGGFLRFPEFGPALYAAPTGGAVVFSCSLLHEATPVIAGTRYMFLPFLYDEESCKIREQNESTIVF